MNINCITFALATLLTILLAALSSAQIPGSSNNAAKASRTNSEVSQRDVEQLLRLGVAADQYGDRHQALFHYQQALSLSRQINNRTLEARALENIGVLYTETSEREQAMAYLRQALAIYREVGDRVGEASMLSSIGYLYHNASIRAQALDFYQQALTDPFTLKELLGHSKIETTEGYVTPSMADMQAAVEGLAQTTARVLPMAAIRA